MAQTDAGLAPRAGRIEARRLLSLGLAGIAIFGVLWLTDALGGPATLAATGAFVLIAVLLTLPFPAAKPALEQPARNGMTILAGNQVLGSVLESIPDPLLLLDRRGRIVAANAAARRLFGPNAVDRPLSAVLRNPALLDAVSARMRGEPVAEVTFSLPVPVERHLQAALSPLPPSSGESGSAAAGRGSPVLLVLFRDVTAARRLERMRVDFVANVSHELRTPLSVLSGFIETLRGPARDDAEARDRFLGIMDQQAQRMARLVADLMSLSRIELDEHRTPTERVDLAALVRQVAAALQPVAESAGVALEIGLPDSLPPVIGDQDQLFQVFQNLLDNAIKYGGPGRPVSVEAAPPAAPGHVAIAVRDRGEGIARAHLPRLTERFYRIDTARSRERGGTGLGLAIVKHVLNRHKGRLTIDSVPGQGSTFTVSLPAAPS